MMFSLVLSLIWPIFRVFMPIWLVLCVLYRYFKKSDISRSDSKVEIQYIVPQNVLDGWELNDGSVHSQESHRSQETGSDLSGSDDSWSDVSGSEAETYLSGAGDAGRDEEEDPLTNETKDFYRELFGDLENEEDYGFKDFKYFCDKMTERSFIAALDYTEYSHLVMTLLKCISRWMVQPWNIVDKDIWRTLPNEEALDRKRYNILVERMAREKGLEAYTLLSELHIRLGLLSNEVLTPQVVNNLKNDITFFETELDWIFRLMEVLDSRKWPE